MYSWVWRHLPGPWPVRLLIFMVMLAAIVFALFMWAFPWAEDALNITDVTVG